MLPPDLHIPGAPKPPSKDQPSNKRHVTFATGGDSGRVRIWRADTGRCIYPAAAAPGAAGEAAAAPAGSEITHLAMGQGSHSPWLPLGTAALRFLT